MPKSLLPAFQLLTSLLGSVKSFQNEIVHFQACQQDEYFRYLQGQIPVAPVSDSDNKGCPFEGYSCHLSFLQSPFWGSFKAAQGWQPRYFTGRLKLAAPNVREVEDAANEERDFALLVLCRSLLPASLASRLPFLSIAYIPFGPVFWSVPLTDLDASATISTCWNPFAQRCQYFAACRAIVQKLLGYIPLSCFFVRLDSNWLNGWQYAQESNKGSAGKSAGKLSEAGAVSDELGLADDARDLGFQQAVQRVQVPDTVLLDLQCGEEELLAQMHKKHRYNIRLAQKRGVAVRVVDWQQGLPQWYQTYQITAQRDRIGIHQYRYYQELFAMAEQRPSEVRLQLYLAYSPENAGNTGEPQVLGGIIVLQHYASATATYLYGASSNEMRELMPNYLLQWQAICDAKEAGMRCYDFFGISPQVEAGHPLYGLYRFKTGFGGYKVQRAGAWDMAYSWLFYGLYRLLERGRLYLYRRRHR